MNDLLNELLVIWERERDPRYMEFVEDSWKEGKRTAESYLGGEEPAASFEDQNYRVVVMKNHRILVINLDIEDKPVAFGIWQGFWDQDLEEVLGMNKQEYDSLTIKQRMEADAEVQLEKYADDQFWDSYASMYHSKEYDKWWWDEGGSKMAETKGWKVVNDYWKNRLD